MHTVRPLGFAQRFDKVLGTHGLDQIAHRTDLESFQGELIMGGAKDHCRRCFPLAQPRCDLEAIETRHADIEQHYVRFVGLDQRQGFFAIGRAGFQYSITLDFIDHAAQSLAGQGFVINDQDIHIALASCVSLAQG